LVSAQRVQPANPIRNHAGSGAAAFVMGEQVQENMGGVWFHFHLGLDGLGVSVG
jgi:hypothetical protein